MANASGSDSNANIVTASSLRIWAEHLQAKALEEDLRKRAHDAHSEFESFFKEGLGTVNQLMKEEQELRRKVTFFEQLLKFKELTEMEDAPVEGTDLDGGLDDSCVALLKEKAEEMVSSVVIKNVQHAAEEEGARLCIEELAESGKLLEGSAGLELSKLYTEAKVVHRACKQEASSISDLLRAVGNETLHLECIALLQKKGYIPKRYGDTFGCSTLNACSGPGCTDMDSL